MTAKESENCVISELTNMIYELEAGDLYKENLLLYVSQILLDSQMDDRSVINIMEDPAFGEEGKDRAMDIKRELGY